MNQNDKSIDQILHALRIDPPSESIREKARHRALVAFRNAPPGVKARRHILKWLLPIVSVAALILIAAFVMRSSIMNGADNSRLFSEVENMFKGKLIAAIKDGDSLDLRIADSSAPLAMDQRILLTLKKGSHVIQVLTYSGREVSLSLSGRALKVTPLVSGDGSILLVTDHDLLTGNRDSKIAGFSFTAKSFNGKQS